MNEIVAEFAFDLGAQLRRLAEPCLHLHRLALADGGHHLAADLLPEIVDFGRNVELVVENRFGLLHVPVFDRDVDAVGFDRRRRVAANEVAETGCRLLERDRHLRRLEVFAAEARSNLSELVQPHGRLARRRASADESPNAFLDILDRGPIFSALPHVGEADREFRQRT